MTATGTLRSLDTQVADVPLFSVIVPVLNERQWLQTCLDALRDQTLDRSFFELIFVDNGSSDGSRELLEAANGILLLTEERRDPYIARNTGIAAARGTYLVLLDADCIPHRCWLEEMAASVGETGAAVILGGIGYPEPASVWLRCYRDYYDQKLTYIFANQATRQYFGHAGNMAVRTSVMRTLGPFLPMPIVGDTEILHRLTAELPNEKVVVRPSALVIHAEVATYRLCLRKVFESGTYSQTLSSGGSYRTLSRGDRMAVAAQCVAAYDYDLARRSALWSTLAMGWLAFNAGWWWRALTSPSRDARPRSSIESVPASGGGASSAVLAERSAHP